MNNELVLSRLPEISREELYDFFPKLNVADCPELSEYTWEEWHKGSLGAGDLYLAAGMARLLELKAGQRVLELGAGHCLSAAFLAKHFEAWVVAADIGIDPTDNWKAIVDKGVGRNVLPLRMDARGIIFPEQYFDAVFSLNSYMYFGTDDLYLPYLLRFVKPGGRICICSPCYSHESLEIPAGFLFDPPEFHESFSMHSPEWWRHHFEKMGLVDVYFCREHEKGREIWLDSIRWQLESGRDLSRFEQHIRMLLNDENRFITYFTLAARKKPVPKR